MDVSVGFSWVEIRVIYEWIGKNVKLGEVAEKAGSFFRCREFKIAIEEKDNKWIVSAFKRLGERSYVVGVEVYGAPEDFFVRFDSNAHYRTFGMFSSMLSLSGFGFVVRRDLDKAAFLERMESAFWDYMEASLH